MQLREMEVAVISDVHLGTYGCHAKELLNYLKSIKTSTLILNGDFIDGWQFKKKYFPITHLEVINQIIKMSVQGTRVYYITGNHDDMLRRFSDINMGSIFLRDKLVLQLNNQRIWVFHGDIFDASIVSTPLLAKLGGKGYDLLIRINRTVNHIRRRMGMSQYSFSGRIKSSVKQAVKFIQDFESKAIEVAAEKGFDAVICGHIHQPQNRIIDTQFGRRIQYLNSGDWIENLTALEYQFGKWKIYKYDEIDYNQIGENLQIQQTKPKQKAATRKTTHEVLYEKIVVTAERKTEIVH
jgi:UDP-2,3-diacylglucosamine pyrophosphatase LpxH